MKNTIKLSTLKNAMTEATVNHNTLLNDEHIQKIRDALVAYINEDGEYELVRLDGTFVDKENCEYIAHSILQYACDFVYNTISALYSISNKSKYERKYKSQNIELDYEQIAYMACQKFAEGVPYSKVRETENGVYEYDEQDA